MSPWWALWINFGNTGEWKFVGWLHVGEQDLAPGPKAVVDRVVQGLADQLSSPAVGMNAGGSERSTAQPGPPGRVVSGNMEWI